MLKKKNDGISWKLSAVSQIGGIYIDVQGVPKGMKRF